jgi:hypothetical protein
MNAMEMALNKVNIKGIDFEDKQVDEKAIALDMQIEFMERWLKLLERNASEKEKYNLVIKHGFVSVQQFDLHMACINDVHDLKWDLDDIRDDISNDEIAKREKEIIEKEAMAENIKNLFYYKMVLRGLGKKDITPYGEDILKRRLT